MLGAEHIDLEWKIVRKTAYQYDLAVQIPESLYGNRKNDFSWVFKIEL
jgi:hypothetical protein